MPSQPRQTLPHQSPWHTTCAEGAGCWIGDTLVEVHYRKDGKAELWCRGPEKYTPVSVDQMRRIKQNTQVEDRRPGRHGKEKGT